MVREAGRGGMSTVYEAVDTRLGRPAALKVLAVPPHLLPAQREVMVTRMRREARAVGSLSHPNVVTIFDVGEQDGLHYLVMEYLDGVTLRARLDSGPLLPGEAVNVLDQVAGGLDAVHHAGVVHRDLKPSNVMLLPAGRVKLMDFGVARATDDTTMTQVGSMVGSPAYMAPELVRGDKATRASDIWALGVLLYQMLAARTPFQGDSIPALLYQIAHAEPAPLPGVTPAVARVLERALEKNPAKRFPSARALADAFRAAVAPAPQGLQRTPPPRHSHAKRAEEAFETTAVHPQTPRRNFRGPWPALLAVPLLLGGLLMSARLLPPRTNAVRPPAAEPATRVKSVVQAKKEGSTSPPPGTGIASVRRAPSTPKRSGSRSAPVARATIRERGVDEYAAPTRSPGSRPSAGDRGSGPGENRLSEPGAAAGSDGATETVALLRDQLNAWIAATNARDIERQMRFYPQEMAAFYIRRNVSKAAVHAEKRRVFADASSVDVRINEPTITLSRGGRIAVMRFRKRYVISGGRGARRGEVLQELRWQRGEEGWKIISERDLRVLHG